MTAQDTVDRAAATPDQPQPFAELGLTEDEYERIRQLLGRRPTDAELALYSVMWSEHCSYKSSKVHLRQFAEKAPRSDALLVGIGARTPASSTSATATRSPSRSNRTTTRPTSSRTRARRPGSAASSVTSWPWARGRSR